MKLVCIGDSLTYGYGLKRSLVWTSLIEKTYGIEVKNKGITGDSTTGMVSRFYRDVVENKPTHVMIMGGANDLIMDVPIGVIKSNIATMVHHARNKNIIPIIGVQPLTDPEVANDYWQNITDFKKINEKMLEIRRWIIEFSKIFEVNIIDFCGELKKYVNKENKSEIHYDGLHLSPKGNELLLNIIDNSKVFHITIKN